MKRHTIPTLSAVAVAGTLLAVTVTAANPITASAAERETKASDVQGLNQTEKAGDQTKTINGGFEVKPKSQTTVEYQPTDVLVPFDMSGSVNGGSTQLPEAINAISLMPDDARFSIMGYTLNGKYQLRGYGGVVSRLLSKQETLELLKAVKERYDTTTSGWPWQDILGPRNSKWLINKELDSFYTGKPFGQIFDRLRELSPDSKNRSISILQFTDDWLGGETWDEELSKYAKEKAQGRTMSVIYGDKNSNAAKELTRLGHPNVFTVLDKDPATRSKAIADQFKNTALEKKTPLPSTGDFKVTAEDGVALTSVTLTGPDKKPLPVKVAADKKSATYQGNFAPGKYEVKVEAKGRVRQAKTVTVLANVDKAKAFEGTTKIEPYIEVTAQVVNNKGQVLIPAKLVAEGYPGSKVGKLPTPTITGGTLKLKDGESIPTSYPAKDLLLTYVATGDKLPDPYKPKTIHKNLKTGEVLKQEEGTKDTTSFPNLVFKDTKKEDNGDQVHGYRETRTIFKVKDSNKVLKEAPGKLEKEDFNGYSFEGTMTDESEDTITTVHEYTVIPAPEKRFHTLFVTEDGHLLKEFQEERGKEEFDGYRFVKTETDTSDPLLEKITHVYHKLKTEHKVIGSNKVLKTEDGLTDRSNFSGVFWEKTETLENGDRIHWYKESIPEKKAPVQTGGSAAVMILPIAGVVGLGGLVAGLARRKKG